MIAHLCHTVGALMTDSPATVDPDDHLDTADAMFTLAESRHLPVVRGGKLVGVLSLRDLLAAQLPAGRTSVDAQQAHLGTICVGDVMTEHVITATQDESAAMAARTLLESGISCLPVLSRGKLVGIVTNSDLVRLAADHLRLHAQDLGAPLVVSQLMSSHPTTVCPDDRVKLAELLMRFGHFHHLPVVADHRLVGIVSDHDVLAALRSNRERISEASRLIDTCALRVEEIMTRGPDTVTPSTLAAAAGIALVDHSYGALPVVDGEKLVGIITERDFLRYLLDRLAPRALHTAHSPMS